MKYLLKLLFVTFWILGCNDKSRTELIILAGLDAGPDWTICKNDSAEIRLQGHPEGGKWYGITQNPRDGIVRAADLDPGPHKYFYEIEYEGSKIADTIKVWVEDFPREELAKLTIDSKDNELGYDLLETVKPNSWHTWHLSSEIPLDFLKGDTLHIGAMEPGEYELYYVVTNNAGCQQQVAQVIEVL